MPPQRKPAAVQPPAQNTRRKLLQPVRPTSGYSDDDSPFGPDTVESRIDGLAATVSVLKQRSRFTLRRILANCYSLLRDGAGSISKLAEIDRALRARHQNPLSGREHALVRAVFRPSGRSEDNRTAKYARALVALKRLKTPTERVMILLNSPGIEALSNMNAPRRKHADGSANDSEESTEPAPSPTTVNIPAAIRAAIEHAPSSWILVELCLAGPRGKPVIRLPRKRG